MASITEVKKEIQDCAEGELQTELGLLASEEDIVTIC